MFRKFLKKKYQGLNTCSFDEHVNNDMQELRVLTEKFGRHTDIVQAIYGAFFNSKDMCYIADMQTYEILWANKGIANVFGGIVGKKCYEVLQGFDAPCKFCTNKYLKKVNDVYEWVFYNQISKKVYYIKDQKILWGNDPVRLEIAIDICAKLPELERIKNKYGISR